MKFLGGVIPLLILLYSSSIFASSPLTVNDVARELACPCECPLVLEDCNMSCGLGWKKEIGKKLKAGFSKEEIVTGFVAKHGHAAKITPMQRIHGKFFQYTRAFGPTQWIVFWSAILIWVGAVFLVIYLLVRKFSKRKATKAGKA